MPLINPKPAGWTHIVRWPYPSDLDPLSPEERQACPTGHSSFSIEAPMPRALAMLIATPVSLDETCSRRHKKRQKQRSGMTRMAERALSDAHEGPRSLRACLLTVNLIAEVLIAGYGGYVQMKRHLRDGKRAWTSDEAGRTEERKNGRSEKPKAAEEGVLVESAESTESTESVVMPWKNIKGRKTDCLWTLKVDGIGRLVLDYRVPRFFSINSSS